MNATQVIETLQAVMPRFASVMQPQTQLRDLGMDSMESVELLCTIHQEFGVRVSQDLFFPEQTLGELASWIALQKAHSPIQTL